MARSRYSDTPLLDGKRYGTFRFPKKAMGWEKVNILNNIDTVEYTYKVGDRLDHLAARFFGEDTYWWIIAIVNDVGYPFASGGLTPGTILKIPINVNDVLDRLLE